MSVLASLFRLRLSRLFLIVLLVPLICPASAAVLFAPIFGDHMVLQREAPVPVFGTADPGAEVVVTFAGQTATTAAAAASGEWVVTLAPMPASSSPAPLTVASNGQTITLNGVQVGEVWLCSGQSNMGLSLSGANEGTEAIAQSPLHNIRLFRMTGGNGPETTSWQIADTSTTPAFSAVGYWMGLELAQALSVPIGLIQATHDGTNISEWQHTNGGSGADYDAMVKAIQPYAVRGVAWYQGESNGGDSAYATKLTDMIAEWRADWGQAALPFGIVQLHWRSGWTAAREAQLVVSQTVPDAFLVVTTDLPGSQLHPPEKKPIGLRLAIGARGTVYGEPITSSGPIRDPATSTVSGSTIVLQFAHSGNGLFTNDGLPPGPFMVAPSSGQYKSATAMIVGDAVHVTSSSVPEPARVRYQWTYGVGNLYNHVQVPVAGGTALVDRLPASQFELHLVAAGDTSPPAPPSGLTATPGEGSVTLDWTANVEPDLAGYDVARSTTSGGPHSVIATGLTDSTYTDLSVSGGITYYYVVTAVDLTGNESSPSPEVAATVPTGSGCTPTSVSIGGITAGTWNGGKGTRGGAVEILVRDTCGQPVAGATVHGTFSGGFAETRSGVSGADGIARLETLATTKGTVSYTFCVDDVDAGLPYEPAANAATCTSL